MLWKESEAVLEGNGPIPQQEEFGSGQPTLEDGFREMREKLDKFHDDMMRLFEKLAARLEQDGRQPRLAMETDGPANTKTRERTEGVATAVQAMRGDILLAGLNPARRPRPLSALRPNLPLFLAGMTTWSRAAMPHPSLVSHPWRCAHQQPLVA